MRAPPKRAAIRPANGVTTRNGRFIGTQAIPVSSADQPRASWKYSVMKKNVPASATYATPKTSTPTTKRRWRNSDGSIIGAGARRCQATNAVSTTAAAASMPSVASDVHACWFVSISA